MDVLDLQCEHCGRAHTLEFDISPFHGKPDTESFQQLVKDQQHVWHMFVWSELRMESVMDYLSKLAGNGDALAIEYIANAARHFLAIAESNHELDSRR